MFRCVFSFVFGLRLLYSISKQIEGLFYLWILIDARKKQESIS